MTRLALRDLPDLFLPPALRSAGLLNLPERIASQRARRSVALLLVMVAGSLVSTLAQLAQGLWSSGLGAGLLTCLVGLMLAIVRRRGPSVWLMSSFVVLGSVGAMVLAVGAGREGYISLFWVGLGPTLTLATSGHRVAFRILLLIASLSAVSVLLIVAEVVPPFIHIEHIEGPHIVSLLGAMATYYFLSSTYERETESTIAELARSVEEIRAARAEAERAARARGDFLAMMGHEVRTPLNGVLGMASVMLSEQPPPHIRDGLQTIENSGGLLRALLDNLLDYSKFESGPLALEARPVDVGQIARDVIDLMAGSARERGDELVLEVSPDAPRYVRGDETRLRQVLNNLVSNAVKFTERGRVRMRVSGEQGQLVIAVADEGLGMDAATVGRLFQPFMQANETTTRRFGGTGLGLAIVRLLVNHMRGRIDVRSEPGQGSTFSVTLPWPPCDAPAPPAVAPLPRGAALRVLVVEDNLINLRVAQRLLEQLGHTVTSAGDGAAALECVERSHFDLVLMDCHMPVMDGFTATEKICSRPGSPPVVALTASTAREDLERCRSSGMVEVLSKPVNRDELARVLLRFAARPDARRARES